MNRALVLRELTRRGAWSAGVKDEELRLENVHGIVSGPRNRAADRVRTDRDRGNHTDYWAGAEQEQEARPPAPADCLADCRRARRRGWTAGCMAGVRRVYGVWRIAGLAGDLHHRGRHRRRRLRDRRSRDPARSPPCAGRRAGAAGAAVHRARRGLDLRRIPDHRHPRRLHAVRLARLNRGTQGRDECQRLA